MFSVPTRSFSLSRRRFAVGAGALALSAAVGPAFGASVDSFVGGVWAEAKGRGVPRKIFDAAMGDFAPLPKVMDLTRKQLTRDRAVWDVRLPEGRGRIEAEIVDGKVTRLGFS